MILKYNEFLNESSGTDLVKKLPKKISSTNDAEKFLIELARAGKIFHFDDDAHDIITKDGQLFTEEEAEQINELVDQAFSVCEKKFGKNGFWEGFIKDVLPKWMVFSGSKDVYIIKEFGGSNDFVKKISEKEYEDIQIEYRDKDGNFDVDAFDKWFHSQKNA
jgi:hypothetical protein